MRFNTIFLYSIFWINKSFISIANLIAEESIEDKWAVSYIDEDSVHAAVNGQVVHGDELRISVLKTAVILQTCYLLSILLIKLTLRN